MACDVTWAASASPPSNRNPILRALSLLPPPTNYKTQKPSLPIEGRREEEEKEQQFPTRRNSKNFAQKARLHNHK
ncbi:hypothetical protein AVEN_249395-1 [Araneus ventricosus]|uniref:Uncharacterized protein n=1 Tax=Araneus ventricosus TaxID=182803 RepID=A0A4Y2IAM2_ARAVE|nr:hypothetical protein AVEN_249395-1 [Araneus ventricosus]